VADKHTQLVLDALSRAAAEPAGTPLFGTRSDPGLFPATAAARPAARKALDDGLLRVVGTEAKGKATRELCAATEAGLRYLLDQVSPKQVLEDFVRALERREGQVSDLVAAAGRMAETLDGLKAAVAVVLPQVQAARISFPPNPPAPFPGREGGEILHPSPLRGGAGGGVNHMTGVATLEAPAVPDLDELAGAVLARLTDWSASAGAGQDCPLPELYKSLTTREVPPTIGVFHDCLRQLHADHKVYLHPWTGPLYALPEPAYALLVGHNVAYYASTRQG
jgi:hypothetical protein